MFFSLVQDIWELMVVIAYYFQIWNKKEYNIIISRVISSHRYTKQNLFKLRSGSFKIHLIQVQSPTASMDSQTRDP